MTAETLAAALLKDVPRVKMHIGGQHFMPETEVLAALSRAMSDDLAERARAVLEGVTPDWEYDEAFGRVLYSGGLVCEIYSEDEDGRFIAAARELVPALLTANAALRAALDEAEARAVKAEAERDAAYAKGFSDAETEISATAIGQQNIALHDQLSRAKAERERHLSTLEHMGAAVEQMQKAQDRAERLEAALTPFVDHAKHRQVGDPAWRDADAVTIIVSVEELRAVGAALKGTDHE